MARSVTIRSGLVVAIATMAAACAPLPHRPFHDVEATSAAAGLPVASPLSRVGFAPANATAARRIETVDRIWRTIGARYYDPSVNGVDVDALRERSVAGAREAASDADFYRVLQRDVNAVGDSHTRVLTPRRVIESDTHRATEIGLDLDLLEGRVVVTEVEPHFSADEAGVRPGMIVEAIDGVALDAGFFERVAVGASRAEPDDDPSTGLEAVWDLLQEDSDEPAPHRLALLRADDSRWEAVVASRLGDVSAMATYRLLPSRVALLRISKFDDAMRSDLVDGIEQARVDSRALIVDLRGNVGGTIDVAKALVAGLVDRPTSLGEVLRRSWRFWWPTRVAARPVERPYRAPVALVVDGGTASAAELVAHALVEQRGAITVGESTCGCVVGLFGQYLLPDGGALRIAELGFRSARGRRMEGDPLVPDVAARPALADLRSGRDVAVEVAERTLLERVATP